MSGSHKCLPWHGTPLCEETMRLPGRAHVHTVGKRRTHEPVNGTDHPSLPVILPKLQLAFNLQGDKEATSGPHYPTKCNSFKEKRLPETMFTGTSRRKTKKSRVVQEVFIGGYLSGSM